MSCPFLKEGCARYCHVAPIRKLILDGPGAASGICASPRYLECELVNKNEAQHSRCPHLEQMRVQYCGISPVTKFVPFSDSALSNCTGNSYRYCDSYLMLARPHASTAVNLLYSPNHFWLDVADSGLCHIGLDRFVADFAGSIDGITFITMHGKHCPALALTIHGVEWPMSFPNPVLIQKVNGRVRSDPSRIVKDPYGAGWLFEGWEVPGRTRDGLVSGAQASAWQGDERARLALEIHETDALDCDGGMPVSGIAQLLPHRHLVCLLQHFLSKHDWTAED